MLLKVWQLWPPSLLLLIIRYFFFLQILTNDCCWSFLTSFSTCLAWCGVCLCQGFIVASPQLSSTTGLIAPLGSQYPPGTKFAIVPGEFTYDIKSHQKFLELQSYARPDVVCVLLFSWSATTFSASCSVYGEFSHTRCCPQAAGATDHQKRCDAVKRPVSCCVFHTF